MDAVAAVRDAGAGDAGEYRCHVSSPGGATAEKSISLEVVQRPSIVKDLSFARRQADGVSELPTARGRGGGGIKNSSDNANSDVLFCLFFTLWLSGWERGR